MLYFFFKINQILFKKIFFKKIIPGFYIKRGHNVVSYKENNFHILLNDKKGVHLGDELFWLFTLLTLKKNKSFRFHLDPRLKFFWNLNGVHSTKFNLDSNSNIISPYIDYKLIFNRNYILVNTSDINISKPISLYIFCSLKNYFLVENNFKINSFLKFPKPIFKLKETKYFLFNDEINSGFFRINRTKHNKLISKILELKSLGYKIIKVGTKINKSNNLCDVDFTNKTDPTDIFRLLNNKNVVGSVTFDNYIMHCTLLLNKKAYVSFRGRYNKLNRDYHMKFINTAFDIKHNKNITYL